MNTTDIKDMFDKMVNDATEQDLAEMLSAVSGVCVLVADSLLTKQVSRQDRLPSSAEVLGLLSITMQHAVLYDCSLKGK